MESWAEPYTCNYMHDHAAKLLVACVFDKIDFIMYVTYRISTQAQHGITLWITVMVPMKGIQSKHMYHNASIIFTCEKPLCFC